MRRALFILLVSLCACATPSSQSPLLSLHEDDPDAHTTAIAGATALVDVGSTIRIHLERDKMAAAAPATSEETARLVARYAALTDALRELEAALPGVTAGLAAWVEKHSASELASLKAATARAARPLDKILFSATATGGERFRALLNEELENLPDGATGVDQSNAIVRATRTELQSLRRDLDTVLRSEGIAFQLGAWVVGAAGTRPVHLEGFDTYAAGERVQFDRWRLTLTKSEEDQVRRAESLARDINSRGVVAVARSQGLVAAENMFRRTLADAQAVTSEVQKLLAAGVAVGASAQQTAAEVGVFDGFLRGLIDKYRSATTTASGSDLLIGASSDVRNVVQRASVLAQRVVQEANAMRALAMPPAALVAALDSLAGTLTEELPPIGAGLESILGLAAVNADALHFGEQVRKLSFDQLPSSATIDLASTGSRSPGDSFVLRLAAVRGESAPAQLETRRLVMHRIAPYFDMAAGLIFARAPAMDDRPAGFQAAAAYSVLLKRGSRDWAGWNTLLSPGIGINLSALDFNRDNTPEVGVAAAVSLFRNIVQAGYGYNVFADEWYGFFGVGLPLPTLGGTTVSPAGNAP